MRDFSAPHNRKVVHFGVWAEEGQAEQSGDLDAWNILCRAVQQCTVHDYREDQDVKDALEWFERRMVRDGPVKDFRKSLNTQDPMQRYWELSNILDRLKKGAGY